MDEVLRAPRRGTVSVTLPGFAPDVGKEKAQLRQSLRRMQLFLASLWILALDLLQVEAIRTGRRISHRYHAAAAVMVQYKPSRLNYLLIVSAVGSVLVLSVLFQVSLEVKLDGVPIGAVSSQSDFVTVLDDVEAQATEILGYNYYFSPAVSYEFTLTPRGDVLSAQELKSLLFDRVGEVMKAYVITVDGKAVGASQSRDTLNALLNEMMDQYRTADTISANFVQSISIGYDYAASDIAQDPDAIRDVLDSNEVGQVTYTVQAGDTLSGIAYNHNMSLSQLDAINPGIEPEKLQMGAELVVSQAIPTISVKTVDQVTYTEAVPFEVEKVEDSSLYVGDSKIITKGVEGQAQVTANVTMINGTEQSRDILSSKTLAEPQTQVVAVGTKARPKTAPTGNFRWPTSGTLTSKFGYRTVLGVYRFHEGVDIANSTGTSIYASDGGTVTFAGWRGDYGYLVIISHGNGVETRYGHCSKLLVSVGDKVYQGQKIAKMGSTGRSTGSHCHFEIRINGTPVNPLSYLS